MIALSIISLITIGIVIVEHWSLAKLGIRLDNIASSLLPYALFTIAGALGIFLIAKAIKRSITADWKKNSHFLGFFILISFAQELIFRGFLMPELEKIFSSAILIIGVNAFLFAFMHAIYPNRKLTLPFAFIAGLGFAAIYFYFPNLVLITIAHSILNFVAVLFSFFTTLPVPKSKQSTASAVSI
jgi:membrane protease YdiL (CAAX protease family)